jgi:tRNA1Val (adenine37-N6)-methyltransferase
MSNYFFKFKKFTVHQNLTAMKVGTDGVLLGAWTPVNDVTSILEVGTGTGLIALMLAQRSTATIHALDISSEAIQQATQNVATSPWANRIHLFENAFQHYSSTSSLKYDLIVSNPPYFENSLHSPNPLRTLARHIEGLSYVDLLTGSLPLLSTKGRICIILPLAEGLQCVEFAQSLGLSCSQMVYVFPKPTLPAKRLLIEFRCEKHPLSESEITIESATRHQYSTEFTALVRDFYLAL